jgi:hypothetical protein
MPAQLTQRGEGSLEVISCATLTVMQRVLAPLALVLRQPRGIALTLPGCAVSGQCSEP